APSTGKRDKRPFFLGWGKDMVVAGTHGFRVFSNTPNCTTDDGSNAHACLERPLLARLPAGARGPDARLVHAPSRPLPARVPRLAGTLHAFGNLPRTRAVRAGHPPARGAVGGGRGHFVF